MAKKKKKKEQDTEGMSEYEKLLDSINKHYGGMTIVKANESPILNSAMRIPTDIFGLDVAYGGGIVTGRIHMLRGWESSGKSLLSQKIAAAFQRWCRNCRQRLVDWDEITMTATPRKCCDDPECMRVVWFDAEGCWDNNWARRLGVDVDSLRVIRTEYAEQGIDIADAVIRSGQCDLLVVDSVAQLTPSVEIEESSEKWQMGVHARLMNKAMRKWTSAQNSEALERESTCTVLLINQIRMKIGVLYGSPETSPGGNGLKFASSTIGKVKSTGVVENDLGICIGHSMEVNLEKNKTAPPKRSVVFDILFANRDGRAVGSSNYADQVFQLGVFWGFIDKKGSWFSMDGVQLGQGAENAAKFLYDTENRPVLKALAKKIWAREVEYLDGTVSL